MRLVASYSALHKIFWNPNLLESTLLLSKLFIIKASFSKNHDYDK